MTEALIIIAAVAVLVGGGVAEILKATLLSGLREQARDEATVFDGKPRWYVAMIGGVATVAGLLTGLLGALAFDLAAPPGALMGLVGGVNEMWLWQPVLEWVKRRIGK